MKKYLVLFLLTLLFGCAKKAPEFVPISLNWFEFQAIENAEAADALDEKLEEKCLVSMTRALMENETVRENAKTVGEYDVQYFGTKKAGESLAEFRGKCKDPSDVTDLERVPLEASAVKNCNFTARCDSEGKVRDLRVF